MRSRSLTFFVSVIAIASTLFAGSLEVAVAAPAPAAEAAEGPSCDSPPDTPDATPENRDRFVDLWLGRFRDQAGNSSRRAPWIERD